MGQSAVNIDIMHIPVKIADASFANTCTHPPCAHTVNDNMMTQWSLAVGGFHSWRCGRSQKTPPRATSLIDLLKATPGKINVCAPARSC